MNLPDLYARVVAKRPELAVKDLTPPIPGVRSYWLLPNFLADDTDGDSISSALILAKWVEALPFNHALVREDTNALLLPKWYIDGHANRWRGNTPLEALAAFYLGDEK